MGEGGGNSRVLSSLEVAAVLVMQHIIISYAAVQ